MNVLSLFDGMSCGQQALVRAGIKYDKYFASEIDKYAIKVTMANFPETIQLGSVVKVSNKFIYLSEVYSYICVKYFNNDIQSLQSVISEWEILHRINEEQVFTAYFGTQKQSEIGETQSNPDISINDRIWFWKCPMGNNKGVYDIIRSGERGKISNIIDVGELCQHSFWWNGYGQQESRIEKESIGRIERSNSKGINEVDIEGISKKTIFNERGKGTPKDESKTTILRSNKEEELYRCNGTIKQKGDCKEEENNGRKKTSRKIFDNEKIIQTSYDNETIVKNNGIFLSIYNKIQVTIIECEWGVIILKGNIQMTLGGSPCQSFSFAGKRKGMSTKDSVEILTLEHYLELKEQQYEFEGQSYLFWEYMRLLNEVKPKYFLLENVLMGEKWERVLSKAIGVNPIEINSSLVSAQNRRRLYWTNIGMQQSGLFGDMQSIIKQPKDKGILLKDILEPEVDEKYYLSDKMISYMTDTTQKMKEKGNGFGFKPTNGNSKSKTITTKEGGRIDNNFILGEKKKSQKEHLIDKTGVDASGETEPIILDVYNKKLKRDYKVPTLTDPCHGAIRLIEPEINRVGLTEVRTEEAKKISRETGTNPKRAKELVERTDNKTGALLTSPTNDNLIKEEILGGDYRYDDGIRWRESGKSPTLMARAREDISGPPLVNTFRIRRLTPIECERLQTVKDNYTNHVSDSQRYKMLGNGWTIDVISYIFSHLKQ